MATIPPPPGHSFGSDQEEIAAFLDGTRETLLVFVEFNEFLLPSFMREQFVEAWSEVDHRITVTQKALLEPDDPDYSLEIPPLFRNPDVMRRQLEMHGLTGTQLTLKLTIYRHFFDAVFEEEPRFTDVIEANPTEGMFPRNIRRFKLWSMRKLLGVTNSLLGSLSAAFPPAGMIKEFKEMAEHGYDMGQAGS